MGLYDALDIEEGGKEFGHIVFEGITPVFVEQNKLPSIQQNRIKIRINKIKIKHLSVKLHQEQSKKLQEEPWSS